MSYHPPLQPPAMSDPSMSYLSVALEKRGHSRAVPTARTFKPRDMSKKCLDELCDLAASARQSLPDMVDICAISLEMDADSYMVLGVPDDLAEKMKSSRLFKVLVRRALPTIIMDARSSHMSKDPLVVAEPCICSYAEQTLTISGAIRGSVVLANRVPWDDSQKHSMQYELSQIARSAQVILNRAESSCPASIHTAELPTVSPDDEQDEQQLPVPAGRSMTSLGTGMASDGTGYDKEFHELLSGLRSGE